MKKIAVFFLLLIALLFLLGFYLMRIREGLKSENEKVELAWEKVIQADKERTAFLRENTNRFTGLPGFETMDSLLNVHYYPDANTKPYMYRQSRINNYTVMYIDQTEGISGFRDTIRRYDARSNQYIEDYNKKAGAFNRNASAFPNIIVSRKYKYKRKAKFRVVYGMYDNMEEKDKKMQEWMSKMEREKGL
ncbi:hypothetical protein [Sinomicrobium soli]|uniref:hypothetical protein n=1 Tax=Sinomicrobium sp. N-1-3-6 TaxID=2219864 RepID=UPI000DCC8AD6|nr:hypothetical protein [Sinomicrobium sp. N-1-3-6]RAV28249.1 hypothetical protein DN748_13880 [Sinomicrobium sp. N-1-3-6]